MEVQRVASNVEDVTLIVEELSREISCRYSCNRNSLLNHPYFSARSNYSESEKRFWHVTVDSDTIFNSIVSQTLLPCRRDINRNTRIHTVGTITKIILQCMEKDSMDKEALKREDSLADYLKILCTKPNLLLAHHISLILDYSYMVNLLERYMGLLIPTLPPMELWSVFEYLLFVYTGDTTRIDNFSPAALQSPNILKMLDVFTPTALQSPAISKILDISRFLHWTDETINGVASALVTEDQHFSREDYAMRIKQYIYFMKQYNSVYLNKAIIGNQTDNDGEEGRGRGGGGRITYMDIEGTQEVKIHHPSRGLITKKNIRDGEDIKLEGVVRVPNGEYYKPIFAMETKGVTVTAKILFRDNQTKIYFDYFKSNPSSAIITTKVYTTNATESFSETEFDVNIMERIRVSASEAYSIGCEKKDYLMEDKLFWINSNDDTREQLISNTMGNTRNRENEYVVFRINLRIRASEMLFT